jgi:hypothetical protein
VGRTYAVAPPSIELLLVTNREQERQVSYGDYLVTFFVSPFFRGACFDILLAVNVVDLASKAIVGSLISEPLTHSLNWPDITECNALQMGCIVCDE